MTNRAIYIKTDGSVESKPDKPTLEQMQKFVGGFIQVAPVAVMWDGRKSQMVMNEEGALHNLPVNVVATQLWRTVGGIDIVGNVILLQGYRT